MTKKQKDLMKEALNEWAEEKFKLLDESIGKWFRRAVVTAIVFGIGYFLLTINGWHR